ncbi:hypothetical protein CASFOL_018829 [Castilleja foliolosa]|uniref:Uncharacterized protein n=1 Tax=Castilleja foliolosa TaxID=1961234 RepID=A0ABD3D2N0_9LAMI
MSSFWAIIFLTFAFSFNPSESNKHHRKLPSAVVVGTVYCDTCFQQNIPKSTHFIAGATVAVECNDNSKPSFRQEVKTDIHGEFKVNLPFHVSKHLRKIKACSVKLISSNKPYCSIAATATSSNLNLKSRKPGTHIFSAGFFTFKPLNKPTICNQKPIITNINDNNLSPLSNPNDTAAFPPPIQDPPRSDPPTLGHLLPPLPQLPPLPELPRLPPLPKIPLLPPKHKQSGLSDNNNLVNQPDTFPFPPNPLNPPSIFPPNPFQPPPSVLPPVLPSPPPSIFPPVLPSPPPSIFPPLFPSPPSPPFFQLPPIPGLTPMTPPPPPPVLPVIPLPPFPFQPSPGLPGLPSPGFPGVPPAKVSLPSKTGFP